MVRFVVNLFWSVAGLALLLAILYAVLRFFRARGGALGNIASTVTNVTQP